jgi:hypothetical protein
MTRATIASGAIAVIALVGLAAGYRALHRNVHFAAAPPAGTPSTVPPVGTTQPPPEARPGFLYGRVTTVDGATYEGRLRWGRDQEAFWGDYFNGTKDGNPWVRYVPPERVPKERRRAFHILGFWLGPLRELPIDLTHLFMTRFGDIARIEARGHDVRVTLKSGTVFALERMEASDFDDGVRVWDAQRGVVDLDSLRIRTIELLPTAPLAGAPARLHATVHTRGGDFTGFVQWDRWQCVGTDMLGSDLLGRQSANSASSIPFDSIRSIARRPSGGVLVTLRDGREVVLHRTQRGDGNHGMYVDDPRYGRVLVSWDAFERLDFTPGDSGPAYGDFPPGRPLSGSVTTRGGRRLAGRLVYDLDETETTETLDAPSQGVDYTIPFGLVASIVVPRSGEGASQRAKVTLQSGEELQLERKGDLGVRNGGLLVFADGSERAEYVPWSDVAQIDFAPANLAPRANLP